MRYLVTARVKPGRAAALADAIDKGTLGQGSIAGDEYLRNMNDARQHEDGRVQWVEVCFCPTPLAEEREYWEDYFTLEKVQAKDGWITVPDGPGLGITLNEDFVKEYLVSESR